MYMLRLTCNDGLLLVKEKALLSMRKAKLDVIYLHLLGS